MNKNLLVKHIVAALGESLEVLERAARARLTRKRRTRAVVRKQIRHARA